MARQLLVLLACVARVALGRLGSGANLTQSEHRCGKQGEVCAAGTGCKCDDHGSCACTQRCGSSGYLCDYGQECSCGDYGSCKCVDKPRLPCSATPAKGVCGDADLMCFLDPTCLTEGGTGCNAGGVGQECRFCGNGGGDPPCPSHALGRLGSGANLTQSDESLLAGATAVYCNPTLTDPPQYCPGGVACPNCGSDRCACPTGPSPPSPTPPSTGCKQLSGTYCAGGGQECNCAYCDDFSKNDECANTCRVMNGYFSSPFREHPWAPVWLENPVNVADGTDCSWMKGNGDDCKKCDEYAMACRRANPPHIGATYSENSGGNCKAW